MNSSDAANARLNPKAIVLLICRLVVGGMFIYTGVTKALHPVDFHKLIVQYHMVPDQPPYLLNVLAAVLPWLELWCGVLLITGIALRGSALVVLIMLIGFTISIYMRAMSIYHTGTVDSFCSIAFDCGCGTGEQHVCYKLPENVLLCLMSAAIVLSRSHRFCLRRDLLR